MDKQVKLKMVALEYNLAVRRGMLTVPDLLDRKRDHPKQPRTLIALLI
jgi:hypothetical protein